MHGLIKEAKAQFRRPGKSEQRDSDLQDRIQAPALREQKPTNHRRCNQPQQQQQPLTEQNQDDGSLRAAAPQQKQQLRHRCHRRWQCHQDQEQPGDAAHIRQRHAPLPEPSFYAQRANNASGAPPAWITAR